MTSGHEQFSVIIDMVLKRAKCDLNGVKIAIFAAKMQKSPAAGSSAPSVTRLSCNVLFSTDPTETIFVQKTFTFGSSSSLLAKSWLRFWLH